jgi:hypothetical protein
MTTASARSRVKRNRGRRLEALGSQSLSNQSPDQQFLPPTEAQPAAQPVITLAYPRLFGLSITSAASSTEAFRSARRFSPTAGPETTDATR